jgi:hypothetical protein
VRTERATAKQGGATLLRVGATLLRISATLLRGIATLLRIIATLLRVGATLLRISGTLLRISATLLRIGATLLRIGATLSRADESICVPSASSADKPFNQPAGQAIASANPGNTADSSSIFALAMPSSSRASTPLTVVSCWSADTPACRCDAAGSRTRSSEGHGLGRRLRQNGHPPAA